IPELLLDHVADHAHALGSEDVKRIRRHGRIGGGLKSQQAYLRPIAVRDDHLMLSDHGSKGSGGPPDVCPLVLCGQRLATPQQSIAAECYDKLHAQAPIVATSTALIVCIRFSACSKTTDASDSKTLSETS